ncbi:hypothetical protein [Methylobacterium sp. E-045]|uniref:hypothetical protein n=1 Tax=Methylobacterium sp. E-045 TaxID=2836575 RepID=UPI001FBA0D8C|nr:hypothetical protein [Methylobacterium sp. E-045]MCJ2132244.1 hypothetical protein [Methylobacterium sp. E-045]
MRASRAIGFSVPLVAWLFAGCLFGGGMVCAVPGAQAQGSLTPLAGQPRVTAPGGLRGRAVRRHRTHRRR